MITDDCSPSIDVCMQQGRTDQKLSRGSSRTLGHLQRDFGNLWHPEDALQADVVVNAAPRHEFYKNAEVGLPCAGPNELHDVFVPDLTHDADFLQFTTRPSMTLAI
jgi:hypothetical protein